MADLPIWLQANAWREILTQTLADFAVQTNTYPDWLINPETQRRLKIDFLVPELGLAIRLEGQQAKERKTRLSLQEEAQEIQRKEARQALCQANGYQLLAIDLLEGLPKQMFRELDMAFSRTKRQLADPQQIARLNQARTMASEFGRKSGTRFSYYAQLWRDRSDDIPTAVPNATLDDENEIILLEAGMDVEHVIFGLGTITEAVEQAGDLLLTIDFLDIGEKRLLASLVSDKLTPLS